MATREQPNFEDLTAAPPGRIRELASIPRITMQAFCETHEVTAAVEGASADRRMSRSTTKIQTGGIAAAIEFYRQASTPNLIVLETTDKREKFLADLERLSEVCDAGTKVVVIGHVNDVFLYRELVRRGVSEYVVTPVAPVDILEIMARLYADPQSKPQGRVIAFYGAKGGVGASTLAHNIAWFLAHDYGLSTIIADLDTPYGTANLDFNIDPPQGIADAISARDRLDINFFERLLTVCTEQLQMLAAPSTLDQVADYADVTMDPILDLARGSASCIVLDVPHVWTGWSRRVMQSADELVIVASPDLANLRNAKNLIDTFRLARANDAPPKLILNQIGVAKKPEIKPADFARALELQPIGLVPFDPQLFGAALNNGQMLFEIQKNARATEIIRDAARGLLNKADTKKVQASSGNFFDKLGDLSGLLKRG